MGDDRGNLALEFIRLAERETPKWIVWENVPGVLSSNKGRDFGTFLGALAEIGYGFAYRILDAQYFGVPQRRRRLFVVGYLGDWRRAAAVLFERESLLGHSPPSRAPREKIAPAVEVSSGSDPELMATLCAKDNEKWGCNQWVNEGKAVIGFPSTATADEAASAGKNVSPTIRALAPPMAVAYPLHDKSTRHKGATGKGSGNGLGVGASGDPSPTLTAADRHAVAFAQNSRDEVREMPYSGALSAAPGMKQTSYLRRGLSVRRLTPRECERLQGFPDDYTQVPYRNKPADKCPDGPRYKALGNSMAVPVMRWIGARIQQVDKYG